MIKSGRSDTVVHHLHHCWKSCDTVGSDDAKNQNPSTLLRNLNTPRSILCKQLQSILASIPSKREVAMFCRAILRHCAKQEMPNSGTNNFMSQHARDQLDGICKKDILPFLQGVLLPSLSKEAGLAEALVFFIVLSGSTLNKLATFNVKIE